MISQLEKQRNSIRVYNNKIEFDDLFIQDIHLAEIYDLKIQDLQKNIEIERSHRKISKIRVEEEFFYKEYI